MKSWKILLLFALWGCNSSQHTLGMLPDDGQLADPLGSLIDGIEPSTGPERENAEQSAAQSGGQVASPASGSAASDTGTASGGAGFDLQTSAALPTPADVLAEIDDPSPIPAPEVPDDGCDSAPAELQSAKLVLVFDSTFQIDLPQESGLPRVSRGVSAYLEDKRSTNSYAALFVVQNICGQLAYARPDASLSLLPQEAARIANNLPSSTLSLTQAEDAVLAAVKHASRIRSRYPEDGYGVVVISDGFIPGLCVNSGATDLMNAFSSGQDLDPPINVYIVSLQVGGFETGQWSQSASAESLATAGGTREPLRAELLRTGQTDVVNEALQSARYAVQPCQIDVREDVPPASLRVLLEGNEIPMVSDADSCGGQEGFYPLDSTDARVGLHLCASSCDRLKTLGAGQFAIRQCPVETTDAMEGPTGALSDTSMDASVPEAP